MKRKHFRWIAVCLSCLFVIFSIVDEKSLADDHHISVPYGTTAEEFEKTSDFKNIIWYDLLDGYIINGTYITVTNGDLTSYYYFDVQADDLSVIPDATKYNNNPDIIKNRIWGDLSFSNIVLSKKYTLSTLTCNVSNIGSEPYYGSIRLILFNRSGDIMAELIGYMGEQINPGETRFLSCGTDANLMNAQYLKITADYENPASVSINRKGIIEDRFIDNIIRMEKIRLFNNGFGMWAFECNLGSGYVPGYTIPDSFQLDLTFKSEEGACLLKKSLMVQADELIPGFFSFYTGQDMSDACYLETETNLPAYTPPTPTPVVTPTPDPEVAATPTPIPSQSQKPMPSPVISSHKKSAVKVKQEKLIKPVIRLTTKKYRKKMRIAKIRLKKYQGTNIEIYYCRGKGKFKKVKLRQSNIKKNKKIFSIGYKRGKKAMYLRVRTYKKKNGKKIFSTYSKKWRVR